jgi:hypothetical protein
MNARIQLTRPRVRRTRAGIPLTCARVNEMNIPVQLTRPFATTNHELRASGDVPLSTSYFGVAVGASAELHRDRTDAQHLAAER